MQIAAAQNKGFIRLRQIPHVSFCQQSILNEALEGVSIEFSLTFAILFFKCHREAQERLEP